MPFQGSHDRFGARRIVADGWPSPGKLGRVSPIAALLRTPGVRGVLATSMVARLPMGALGLLLLLRARELGFSYAVGGLAAGALALGFAAAPPVLGRLVDRRGARAVLLPTAVAGAASLF